jgi:nicotinamide mononucleotide transporter
MEYLAGHVWEIIGFLTGILGVWLTIKQNPWCWVISIANVLLYAWIFYTERLYADTGLHILYCILSVYGLYTWTKRGNNGVLLAISKIKTGQLIAGLAVSLIGAFFLAYILGAYSNADYPFCDSALTSLCIYAQILQTRKKIENWYVWIAADAGYIALYAAKGLIFTSVLYAVYCILAWRGLKEWQKA